MAADWIKMRGNLWDDPRVSRLCDLTDQGEAAIIGGLYWLWASADQHTADGYLPGLSVRQIDRKTGVQGLGAALCEIGWIEESPDGVRIVNFEEHNGSSAKRRVMESQRKANGRSLSASDADKTRTSSGHAAPDERTEVGQGAELEKEEEKEKSSSSLRSEGAARKRAAVLPAPDDIDPQVWADWLQLRKAKKAPVTETVIESARGEAAKAGMSLESFLRIWCSRGSQGLQADWLKPNERNTGPPASKQSALEARNAAVAARVLESLNVPQ